MGYKLSIGEFAIRVDHEARDTYGDVDYIDGAKLGAPLNSSEHHGNDCDPSYSGWAEFARRADLFAVFFARTSQHQEYWNGKAGLLQTHPGSAALTTEHLTAFENARDRYEKLLKTRPSHSIDPGVVMWDRRRLEWLCWWTKWTLENCAYPTFKNS